MKMDVLRENSNEDVYDTIHPKASSIKEKDINPSLFSRVFSLLYSRTRSNFSSTDSISSEKGEVKISNISPKHQPESTCSFESDERKEAYSVDRVSNHDIESIHDHYKNQTILERIRYYNTLCEMANILRHIYYYFRCDVPIFTYKSLKIVGTGHLVFNKGYQKHLDDLETYRIFKTDTHTENGIDHQHEPCECDHDATREFDITLNNSYESTKGDIFTIYTFLLQYKTIRTNNNYPILIYKYFIWYESYIYMRTIPLNYIIHSNLSNGPIGCNVCKEYAHPTLKIFQNYCEYCFKEIKSRIDESNQESVPETNI